MNPNQRQSKESQKEYKERLRRENKAAKGRMGRLLWDSQARGTYRKSEHGPLQ